jgi:hypothetical protein
MPRPFGRVFGRRDAGAASATYAAVLDGVHLWLDVEPPVTARDVDSKALTELGPAPYDLRPLTGAAYDVLTGQEPVRLLTPPQRSLTRTPLSPDGTTQWEVERLEDGALRLTRHAVAPTAELDAVAARGDRVHLRVRPPAAVQPGWHLLLLDTEDQVRSTLPVTAHEGLLEALIGVDDLPAGYFGVLRLAVGTDDAWVRIRRRANDLTDPNHAVLLPELSADPVTELGHRQVRARLRWNPDGLLALRSIDPDDVGQHDDGAER